MIRFETNVVRKFFDPIDLFVKIRVFTADEIAQLLRSNSIVNRQSYMDLVINACMVNYSEEVLPRMPMGQHALEDKLYALCIEVNPGLDIKSITLPATQNEHSELHLLEQKGDGPVTLDRLGALEEELRRRIIGQDVAIRAVSRALRK